MAAMNSPSRSARRPWSGRLHDGSMRGRRGIYANNTLALGLCAALQIDGITVVVISTALAMRRPGVF